MDTLIPLILLVIAAAIIVWVEKHPYPKKDKEEEDINPHFNCPEKPMQEPKEKEEIYPELPADVSYSFSKIAYDQNPEIQKAIEADKQNALREISKATSEGKWLAHIPNIKHETIDMLKNLGYKVDHNPGIVYTHIYWNKEKKITKTKQKTKQ